MMHRIILVSAAMLLIPLAASAQTPVVQLYGGYAYTHADSGGLSGVFRGRSRDWNGWETSFSANFTRFVGVTFDFSGDYGPDFRASFSSFSPRLEDHTPYFYAYMAGPQFLLPLGRVLVFAHALAGATQTKRGFTTAALPVARTDFGFGSAVGAGIDVSLTRYVALRIAQADYLISKNFGGTQNNLRVSGGLVFEFGGK
jgi:hypothetical protein